LVCNWQNYRHSKTKKCGAFFCESQCTIFQLQQTDVALDIMFDDSCADSVRLVMPCNQLS